MPDAYLFWKIFKILVHLKNKTDMLPLMQERLRGETKKTTTDFEHLFVNLDGYLLFPYMHQQILSKNLNLFIALSIHDLIPFLLYI